MLVFKDTTIQTHTDMYTYIKYLVNKNVVIPMNGDEVTLQISLSFLLMSYKNIVLSSLNSVAYHCNLL